MGEEHATMWMDPSKMDEKARQYWEFNRGDILVRYVLAAAMVAMTMVVPPVTA